MELLPQNPLNLSYGSQLMRDTLFLLKEDFEDGPGAPYFCPDCATITGLLTYFPKLRHSLDIRYADFPRPRSEIVALLGENHQGCPCLVLAGAPPLQAKEVVFGEYQGRYFLSGAKKIAEYWAVVHGTSRPH